MYRNLGILAHVDAGKTTLTEQLLYTSGVIRDLGSVDDGTARTDSLLVERQRGISVRSATASLKWNGETVNIIDTPGHVDFAGEVERCLEALDFAILVISSPDGIKAHTENLLNALTQIGLPRMIFINKLDRAGSDFKGIISELNRLSGGKTVYMPINEPTGEGTDQCDIKAPSFSYAVTEALAEINDFAAELFLIDETLPPDRIEEMLPKAIHQNKITPVMCGCAKKGIGVKELLDFITKYMPHAEYKRTEETSGIIFKIDHDKAMGKIAHVRMFGGKIQNRDSVAVLSPNYVSQNTVADDNSAIPVEEDVSAKDKVSQIRKAQGGRYSDAGIVNAGDIAALCGLTKAKVGRFVGSVTPSKKYALAHPLLRVRATPVSDHPEALPKLALALKELSDEEPYIDAKWENGQSEIVINLTGSIQSEILKSLLEERYGLQANFSAPTVIYRETPTNKGTGLGVYTMPKPCWAIVNFMFEPMPRGYGVSYHGRLPNNQCFYKYQSHIHRSFNSCLEQGLHGWEVTDFKCTLIGGEHHTVHTHPLDFFVATPMAFMNALVNCGSTLLEPLLKMRIIAPAELSGKLITEIVRGGGEYDAPFVRDDTVTIDSIVPFANFMDFPTRLASFSSGRGVCSTQFYGYRECPKGTGEDAPRRGVNPLDRSKWILWARGALNESQI
ncbi:MAG: TetM/TetW/TetO/TetS family tetracycline resistance ribosomal protection protein [Oscillospiraceae bacterium]|nr:TetM/TetW/TetO/TetS family tetracycline resistance ribosomal protection protein [Oscillospiraceae bacterium]